MFTLDWPHGWVCVKKDTNEYSCEADTLNLEKMTVRLFSYKNAAVNVVGINPSGTLIGYPHKLINKPPVIMEEGG